MGVLPSIGNTIPYAQGQPRAASGDRRSLRGVYQKIPYYITHMYIYIHTHTHTHTHTHIYWLFSPVDARDTLTHNTSAAYYAPAILDAMQCRSA